MNRGQHFAPCTVFSPLQPRDKSREGRVPTAEAHVAAVSKLILSRGLQKTKEPGEAKTVGYFAALFLVIKTGGEIIRLVSVDVMFHL